MNKYRAQSLRFLKRAKKELRNRDYVQASEKLWGAASQAVKAVAQERRWAHNGHRSLFEVVSRIAKEDNDDELKHLFNTANTLHMNFYENNMPPHYVKDSYHDIQRFVYRLLGRLSAG